MSSPPTSPSASRSPWQIIPTERAGPLSAVQVVVFLGSGSEVGIWGGLEMEVAQGEGLEDPRIPGGTRVRSVAHFTLKKKKVSVLLWELWSLVDVNSHRRRDDQDPLNDLPAVLRVGATSPVAEGGGGVDTLLKVRWSLLNLRGVKHLTRRRRSLLVTRDGPRNTHVASRRMRRVGA